MALNPMLWKLKMSQTKCPVYKGQILPLCKDELKTNTNDSLNYAHYYVRSARKEQTHSKTGTQDTFHLSMMPVEWDEVKMKWGPAKKGTVSPHPFDISISSEELHDHFGILSQGTSDKVAAKGEVTQLIEDAFKKAKLYNTWIEKYQNVDVDKMFRGISYRIFNSLPVQIDEEDKEDLFRQSLYEVVTPESIARFDPLRNDNFIGYVTSNFIKHLKSRLAVFQSHQKLEKSGPKDPEHTQDEYLDFVNQQTERSRDHAPTEDVVEYKLLMEDLKDFLEVQKYGDIFVTILEGLQKGYKKNELAHQLGLGPSSFTNYLKRFQKSLEEYAKESENNLLFSLIKEYAMKKQSAEEDVYDKYMQMFKKYKEKTPEDKPAEKMAERVPVGETITIKRKPIPNLEELTKNVVQDPNKSSAQATEDVETYLQDLINSDELIEENGRLIAIQIQRKV